MDPGAWDLGFQKYAILRRQDLVKGDGCGRKCSLQTNFAAILRLTGRAKAG
jgi:hypothetical protein